MVTDGICIVWLSFLCNVSYIQGICIVGHLGTRVTVGMLRKESDWLVPPVSQTKLKPSPRLKCMFELF